MYGNTWKCGELKLDFINSPEEVITKKMAKKVIYFQKTSVEKSRRYALDITRRLLAAAAFSYVLKAEPSLEGLDIEYTSTPEGSGGIWQKTSFEESDFVP